MSGLQLVGSVAVKTNTDFGAFDSGNGFVYLPDSGSKNVTIINGTHVAATVRVASAPSIACYDNANGFVYITDFPSDQVSVINGTTLLTTLSVGSGPNYATYDRGNGYVYVTNFNSNNVSIISGTAVIGSVKVASSPWSATYDDGNGLVYIVGGGVSVINGTKLVGSLGVGMGPVTATYDRRNGLVYVPNTGSNTVSEINGTKVVGAVDVGSYPWSAIYDDGNGLVYVTNYYSHNVSVIDGTKLVGSLDVGNGPTFGIYDSANGYVYVPNDGSSNVSVIRTGYTVTFRETGLPPGTSWGVILNGLRLNSTSPVIAFDETNGSYAYSVAEVGGYGASTTAGSVTVSGANASVPVTFTQVSYLSLNITAAPSAICENESTRCAAGVGESLVTLTAGSPLNASRAVVANGTAQPMFQFIPYGAIRLVPGQHISVSCLKADGTYFTLCDQIPTVFNHSGVTGLAWNWSTLPTYNRMHDGDVWTVSFLVYSAGPPYGPVPVDACVTFSCRAGGSTSYQGLFTWARYETPANSATVVQSFQEAQINVERANASYSVRFVEAGLPSRTIWAINLSGTILASASNSMNFSEPNGSYRYWVPPVVGFAVRAYSRALTVNGTNQNISILFEQTYPVIVQETGLPPGSEWIVDLGFDEGDSRSASISFSELNGTYPFQITTALWVGGYAGTPSSGDLTVAGLPLTLQITFESSSLATYPVTFTETGLPVTTNWSVTLNGVTKTGVGNIDFSHMANGTYLFTIGPVAGEVPMPHTGSIAVHGRSASFAIIFRPSAPTPTILGLPRTEGYAVLGGIIGVAVAVAAMVVILRRRKPG